MNVDVGKHCRRFYSSANQQHSKVAPKQLPRGTVSLSIKQGLFGAPFWCHFVMWSQFGAILSRHLIQGDHFGASLFFLKKWLPWGTVFEKSSLFSGGTIFFLNTICKREPFSKTVPQGSRFSTPFLSEGIF